ncbi:M48 family metalloprotease [Natronococcus sp. JC468]|uniref:M48 family metallopeptidase n=1 Tax=Natronococcus sp. JC468 TaxID=1961921 RepID=UPI001438C37F|nr:M48 family metalloprotease [Natronococcus sp. JC468]NKE35311.1 M48 family metalloprotease [Natronococcus sp. JC468]
MSVSVRRPRVLAVLLGSWLLALAGFGIVVGVRVIEAFLSGTDLLVVTLLAIGIALLFGYLNYRIGTRRLLSRLETIPLSAVRAPSLQASVDRLTRRMNVDRPDVYVARLGQPNAFALGRRTLVVDRSLVRLLTAAELEGVLAHEFAHLERSDGLLRTLALSVLQTVTTLVLASLLPLVAVVTIGCWGLSLMVGRPVHGPDSVGSGLRRGLVRIALGLSVAPILALQADSRRREYAADRRAVAVLDDPLAFARALEKIQRANESHRGVLRRIFLGRERRRNRTPLERALDSHPPTDERVARVREAATTDERGGGRRV